MRLHKKWPPHFSFKLDCISLTPALKRENFYRSLHPIQLEPIKENHGRIRPRVREKQSISTKFWNI